MIIKPCKVCGIDVERTSKFPDLAICYPCKREKQRVQAKERFHRPKRLRYDALPILGTERRKCALCEWWDSDKRHGAYLPNGEYYCTKHAEEFELVEGVWVRLSTPKDLT